MTENMVYSAHMCSWSISDLEEERDFSVSLARELNYSPQLHCVIMKHSYWAKIYGNKLNI